VPEPHVASGRVRLRFFARYADAVGRAEALVSVALPATVADIVRWARALPGGEALPERPLAAVNLRHARLDTPVQDGDEVALLPPLAGG
jgi:molybdopterin synthase sulfur carrier subunit